MDDTTAAQGVRDEELLQTLTGTVTELPPRRTSRVAPEEVATGAATNPLAAQAKVPRDKPSPNARHRELSSPVVRPTTMEAHAESSSDSTYEGLRTRHNSRLSVSRSCTSGPNHIRTEEDGRVQGQEVDTEQGFNTYVRGIIRGCAEGDTCRRKAADQACHGQRRQRSHGDDQAGDLATMRMVGNSPTARLKWNPAWEVQAPSPSSPLTAPNSRTVTLPYLSQQQVVMGSSPRLTFEQTGVGDAVLMSRRSSALELVASGVTSRHHRHNDLRCPGSTSTPDPFCYSPDSSTQLDRTERHHVTSEARDIRIDDDGVDAAAAMAPHYRRLGPGAYGRYPQGRKGLKGTAHAQLDATPYRGSPSRREYDERGLRQSIFPPCVREVHGRMGDANSPRDDGDYQVVATAKVTTGIGDPCGASWMGQATATTALFRRGERRASRPFGGIGDMNAILTNMVNGKARTTGIAPPHTYVDAIQRTTSDQRRRL